MKRYIAIFFIIPLIIKSQFYLRVKQNDKWGVIDSTGRLTADFKYNSISHFKEDLAYAGLNKKNGFIDRNGKEVIPFSTPEGARNSYFVNGYCVYGKKDKPGFINKRGTFIPVENAVFLRDFYEGLAGFAADTKDSSCATKIKYGYIDTLGNVVIEPKFTWFNAFSEGLASVSIKGSDCNANTQMHGYINRKGEWAVKPVYSLATDFKNGYARIVLNEKWGMINKKGEYFIRPQYDWISDFNEDIAVMIKDKLYGLLDNKGEEIIPAKFASLTFFSEGLISFSKNIGSDSVGFLNRQGKIVIPYASSDLCYFHEGFALVVNSTKTKMGKYGFMNTEGKMVIPHIYDYALEFENGFAPVSLKGKWGFIDKKGNFVIRPQFDQVDKIYGLENKKGLYRVLIYTSKTFEENPYAIDSITEQKSKLGYVFNGKIIWQPLK